MAPRRRRNPWWIPPFLGRVPANLDDAPLQLLGVVSLAVLFEEYDMAVLTSALSPIARELHLADARLGLDLAVVRLGAVPAFFVVPLADRFGRRPVFLWSTVLLGLLSFATAFVSTPLQFIVVQALTRTFFVAGTAIALVMVTEEFPAEHRGWGVGMLSGLGAMGAGLSAIMFSRIHQLPFGWRALYVVGIVPVLLLPYFRRRLGETERFLQLTHTPGKTGGGSPFTFGTMAPLLQLMAAYPARCLALGASGFAVSSAMLPTFQFTGHFTQQKLGWSPGQYASMVIVLGAFGIVGTVAAGVLGDRFGRKRIGMLMLGAFPLASFAFYYGVSRVTLIAWVPMVFCATGGRVILRSLSTELFPTAQRGTASGMFSVTETLGAVCGLLLVYAYGTRDVAELARAVPLVGCGTYVAVLLFPLFPETRQRELEEISAA